MQLLRHAEMLQHVHIEADGHPISFVASSFATLIPCSRLRVQASPHAHVTRGPLNLARRSNFCLQDRIDIRDRYLRYGIIGGAGQQRWGGGFIRGTQGEEGNAAGRQGRQAGCPAGQRQRAVVGQTQPSGTAGRFRTVKAPGTLICSRSAQDVPVVLFDAVAILITVAGFPGACQFPRCP